MGLRDHKGLREFKDYLGLKDLKVPLVQMVQRAHKVFRVQQVLAVR